MFAFSIEILLRIAQNVNHYISTVCVKLCRVISFRFNTSGKVLFTEELAGILLSNKESYSIYHALLFTLDARDFIVSSEI